MSKGALQKENGLLLSSGGIIVIDKIKILLSGSI